MDSSHTLRRRSASSLGGEDDRHRHRPDRANGSLAAPGTDVPSRAKKQLVVHAGVFDALRALQLGSNPRIDLMYWATAALSLALENAEAFDGIRARALDLLRHDLKQPS